jgi:hypothetical protein
MHALYAYRIADTHHRGCIALFMQKVGNDRQVRLSRLQRALQSGESLRRHACALRVRVNRPSATLAGMGQTAGAKGQTDPGLRKLWR